MNSDLEIPSDSFSPATQAELRRFVADNAAGDQSALYPVGGRTSLNYGYPPSETGTVIEMSRINRVIDYPARDMTITVEAGIRMDDLTTALKGERQQLPVDVPQSRRATLGGFVATNTSGPRRFGFGTLRDYVIGISAVDARGVEFHSGGRVVKNVAGYDLCKMLVGSMGTLAVISQVTLKLQPLPETTGSLWVPCPTFAVAESILDQLLSSNTRPVAIELLNSAAAKQVAAESRQDLPVNQPVLVFGFEGFQRETAWQIAELKRELSQADCQNMVVLRDADADRLCFALTEFQTDSEDPLTFQANLRPSQTVAFVEQATQRGVSVQAHAGNGIVVGHLPDSAATLEQAGEILSLLRSEARSNAGNLVILNCDEKWKSELPLFGEPEPSWELMMRLKSSLDPQNVLNPGRFIDGSLTAKNCD